MLAPIDKLNKPGGNRIIQVVITRACSIHTCSNCTQLLPFRKDARHMSLGCVEQALISLKGWPGTIACFGGNPCSHPQFHDVCKLWQQLVPNQKQRGLWTNDLLKHGEVAKQTFWPSGVFNLNAHSNPQAAEEMRRWLPGVRVYGEEPCHHGGILLDYRDYGISEQQWTALRENCDINQHWSGAIYERNGSPHVYFCEVTGALDGARNQNHGIPAEPGWWKWPIERFKSQIEACVGCGVPLRTKGHLDTLDTYDISPSWEAPTAQHTGQVDIVLHKIPQDQAARLTHYTRKNP